MRFTQDQIAEMLGITKRQLHRYRDDGMPLDQDDVLCVKRCAIWIHENTNPHAGGWNTRKGDETPAGDINAQIKLATLNKLNEEVREKKLRNEETEGRLYDAAAIEQRINDWVILIRSWVKSIPNRLLPHIPDNKGEIIAALEEEMRVGLRLLHREGSSVDDDGTS